MIKAMVTESLNYKFCYSEQNIYLEFPTIVLDKYIKDTHREKAP